MLDLKQYIKETSDFPQKGVLFRDIAPLLKNPSVWEYVINEFSVTVKRLDPNIIVGIESRGFILGAALATKNRVGFITARKGGKIPGRTKKVSYGLEYGSDVLEIQDKILSDQDRVLIIDDVLATGGTARACETLIKSTGSKILGFVFLIELKQLEGRNKLDKGADITSLVSYS